MTAEFEPLEPLDSLALDPEPAELDVVSPLPDEDGVVAEDDSEPLDDDCVLAAERSPSREALVVEV